MSRSSFSGSGPARRLALATKYVGAAIGDSITFNGTYLTLPEYFPFLAQTRLQRLSCAVSLVNSGVSGNTSGQVLSRARSLATAQSGSLAVIHVGTNDLNGTPTVQASPTPTETTFSVASGEGVRFANNTNIKVNGVACVLQSVVGDDFTLASPLVAPPSAGHVARNDTTQNIIDAAAAMAALGYTRCIVGVHHYLNYSSGGDTLAAQQSLALTTRTAQLAAIAGIAGCVTANFYTHMRNLIVAGTYTQGDHLWHVADQDTHLNAIGEALLADCIMAAIPETWLFNFRT